MKKVTFTLYSDPGHGWIKVPLPLLQKLGIAGNISSYSYWRKGHAFLEEDCDAGLLIDALVDQGIKPALRERVAKVRYSKIRGYEHYRATLHRG